MKLMIDQREKKSYQPLLEKEGISCNSTYLKTGDYGIEGHPDFSIERKELSDLAQCCGRSRDRFEKELQRAVELDYFAVIIEGSIQDILKGKYFSKIKPNSVIGSIFAWSVYYKVPFIFCGDRETGALAVQKLARAYLYKKRKENTKC